MKINNAASARFFSYSVGLLIQISIIFLLTTKLEIYQFGLWGISMSFVFIFSTVSQMAYFQNIEKYFPNYTEEKRQYFFVKYVKTIFASNPIILLFLFIIKYFGYFEKFNIKNISYLLIMLALLSTIESCLVISDGYFVATQKSKIFDTYELYFYKIPRLLVFYLLLSYGYSVFYLLFFTIILRLVFLVIIFKNKFINMKTFLNLSINNSIFKENFHNIRYNSFAFGNSFLYVSFINILFLITSNLLLNIDIAHYSLMVIILNNLRPIMSTIPSLLPPIVSSSIENKIDLKFQMKNIEIINQILISIFLLTVLAIVQFNDLFSIFFSEYFDGIYKLIFLSVFASTLNSIYFTKYIEQLFSQKELNIFKFNCLNYIFCILIFYVIYQYFYLINFIYIYIIYELLFFLFVNYLSNQKNNLLPKFTEFSFTYLLTLAVVSSYIFDSFSFYFYLVIPFGLILDNKFFNKKLEI